MEEISFDNRQDFVAFVKSNKNVIVRVSADWCGPCKRIKPTIDELMSNMSSVKFVYVNYDKHSDVRSSLRVRSVPTFFHFKNGYGENCLIGGDKEKVIKFYETIKKNM